MSILRMQKSGVVMRRSPMRHRPRSVYTWSLIHKSRKVFFVYKEHIHCIYIIILSWL